MAADQAGVGLGSSFFVDVPQIGSGAWNAPLDVTGSSDEVNSSGYEDGLAPVVGAEGSDQLVYYRPMRTDSDVNGPDEVDAATNEDLDVEVHTGRQLTVSASPTTNQCATAGQPVSFSATTDASAAEQPMSITWHFDDGSTSHGSRVMHSFTAPLATA